MGRVYSGLWQETQVAIKVIGNDMLPEAAYDAARVVTDSVAVRTMPASGNVNMLGILQREVQRPAAARRLHMDLHVCARGRLGASGSSTLARCRGCAWPCLPPVRPACASGR